MPVEAARFWQDNANLCERAGTLIEETRSAFVLLCNLWARYVQAEAEYESARDTIRIVMLAKQVQSLMKSFGLTPEARKRLGLVTDSQDADNPFAAVENDAE
jgi:phage terminase small subunit